MWFGFYVRDVLGLPQYRCDTLATLSSWSAIVRKLLVARVPLLAVTAFLPAVYAATTFAADDDAISEVVVTGTRVADRSRLDTVSPVDVLPERTLTIKGRRS